jgi:transcriptional antiterminator Rof (Rho-off)
MGLVGSAPDDEETMGRMRLACLYQLIVRLEVSDEKER